VASGSGVLWIFPAIAALAIAAMLGTDRLGRPLTDEEKRRFGALLREHDYTGVRLVALRFAYSLTRGRASARDLMGRVDLRLVRLGWDPDEVALRSRLCRLVWSEWTHASATSDGAGRAEQGFYQRLKAAEGLSMPSVEQRATDHETHQETEADAQAQLGKLRALFEKAADEVNLLWLAATLDGESDLQKMALAAGRDVTEFYAAAKRRKRAVRRLLAEERGAPYNEKE
jgi:hypothetical protein